MSNDLMRRKHSVVQATSTEGWRYIREIAEDTVKAMERAAIDEEDDTKGATLRRQAKAARQFLTDFLRNVEAMRSVEVPEQSTPAADEEYEIAM